VRKREGATCWSRASSHMHGLLFSPMITQKATLHERPPPSPSKLNSSSLILPQRQLRRAIIWRLCSHWEVVPESSAYRCHVHEQSDVGFSLGQEYFHFLVVVSNPGSTSVRTGLSKRTSVFGSTGRFPAFSFYLSRCAELPESIAI
jgi:hypothetical protein